jgi:hypothetical protein
MTRMHCAARACTMMWYDEVPPKVTDMVESDSWSTIQRVGGLHRMASALPLLGQFGDSERRIASPSCRGQCVGTGFDSLSAHHHGPIHQAGSKAVEPSAVDDNGNDDPQNWTKPDQIDQTVRLTNTDRPSRKKPRSPPRRNGNGRVHESGGDLPACDS